MDEERGAMFTEERQSAIENCLRENGKVKVKELSENLSGHRRLYPKRS